MLLFNLLNLFPRMYFGIWPALIAAGATLGSAYLASRSSQQGQEDANEMNYRIAREQMDFQREGMMNRHQWEVEDLIKAGLNPIISGMGSGPIGMGASATMINPKANRGELAIASAKAINDILLSKEMAQTERTKQSLNKQQEKVLEGAAADSENRAKYARSPFGKGTAGFKNVLSDLGGGILTALGIGGSAKGVAAGARYLRGSRFPVLTEVN